MRRFGLFFLFAFFFFPFNAFAGMATFADRPAVQVFIKQMVQQYQFNGPELTELFRHVRVRKELIKSMNQPKEGRPWYSYRSLFITPSRVANGTAFWQTHEATLNYAAKKYGIPPEVIVSIIGVETNYGKVTGSYPVIDSLATLAFLYPKRQAFFRNELTQYLLLTREHNLNPLAINGSYAGAMGVPQFMPSSYRRFAQSYDNDGFPDLMHDPNDAIISVANYFKNHGWQAQQPIVLRVNVNGDHYQKIYNTALNAKYPIMTWSKYGVAVPARDLKLTEPANLLKLQGPTQPEYWLAFNNFYAISSYNPNVNYTMAVYQLGQAIAKEKYASHA